jgi:hypothetical protein
MTGWGVEFVLRRRLNGAADLTLTTAGGAITFDDDAGTNDRATVAIADTDTLNLANGRYAYALRRTDAGFETLLAHGVATLKRAAAR